MSLYTQPFNKFKKILNWFITYNITFNTASLGVPCKWRHIIVIGVSTTCFYINVLNFSTDATTVYYFYYWINKSQQYQLI